MLKKFRDYFRKHWLVPSFLLFLESTFLVVSIAKGNPSSFFRINEYIVKNLVPSLHFNYHVLKYHAGFLPGTEELENALRNKKNLKKIEELVSEDKKDRTSEIAGIMSIDNKDLNFYRIETRNSKLAKVLEKSINDAEAISEIIEKNKDYYKDVVEMGKRQYQI